MIRTGLIFASENGRSTPRLRSMPGYANPWDESELLEIEAELKGRYVDLARGNTATLTIHDRVFDVEVRPNGRTPTLLLTEAPPTPSATQLSVLPAPWLDGLLADLSGLMAAHPDANIPPLEVSMLRFVADELRQLSARAGAGEVAVLLLAGHLRAAEGLFRTTDADRATVYTMAHRALEKLLGRIGQDDEGVGNPRYGKAGSSLAPAGMVGRWLRKLFGASPSANGTP